VAVVDAVDPIQGICYAPLPCLTNCHASMDIGQSGYENLWASSGRDDLGIMARMGAKSLRVYHPIGEPTQPEPDHAPFLDAVRSAGLSMFAAVHQYLTCPEDNCYDSWNTAVADGLANGFEEGGKWHSAVWAVNMINEVDAIVPFDAPGRQVMRLISAVDGLLAAEMAAKVTGEVKLTSCFTTAIAVPLGGGAATVYHGFSSIEAWIKNPGLVPYTPRSMTTAQLAAAIDSRWVHCANAQIPWSGLKAMIADHYAPFLPRPWFIGEMGFNGASASDITTQLTEMNEYTSEGKGFLGSYMFQFQTAYEKTGSELNFGMFSLGGETLFEAGVVEGNTYDVRCLTSRLYAFDSDTSGCPACNHRAEAVAAAFGGTLSGTGLCLDMPPLGPGGGACTPLGQDPYRTGALVSCCPGSQKTLVGSAYLCLASPTPAPATPLPTPAPAPRPTPSPTTACTPAGQDPWQTGAHVACCAGSQEVLVGTGAGTHYMCEFASVFQVV